MEDAAAARASLVLKENFLPMRLFVCCSSSSSRDKVHKHHRSSNSSSSSSSSKSGSGTTPYLPPIVDFTTIITQKSITLLCLH
uniref:Uncharacterized protein n=1 Tax=Glossina austeni TaxID=7395 RepID=A0A1A9UQ87_GLOAU